MFQLALATLVAACGAAKLDRAYLPPASAKSAGGSPGSLQTPFAGNSFNYGLGGPVPKGSYSNAFQGVVVDAALAGSRTAGETGLGAPRINYGSSDSKVGAAAFRVQPSGFNQAPQAQEFQPDGSESQGQGFGQQGQSQPDYSQASQPGFNQGFNQPQGPQPGANQGSNQPERPKAGIDRTASTTKLINEVSPENFNYAFETDNGIQAEETGIESNGVQAQGSFSYTGDDGNTYTVTYTADENGYQPKGDHLPTPPPIPEAILKSLEQNARDEAAGIVDDGSYDAKKYNTGGDYTGDNDNDKHQSGSAVGGEMDASASGSFIDQNKQPFGKPSQSTLSRPHKGPNRPNTLGLNAKPGKFDYEGIKPSGFDSSNQLTGPESQSTGQFSPSGAHNGFSHQQVNAVGQPSGSFGQRISSSKPKNELGFSSGSNAPQETVSHGFGNINQYLPPSSYNQPQGSKKRPQGEPQDKPQKNPEDSGSSESSSSEENSSEENGPPENILGNSQQNSQESISSQGFPQRFSARPTYNDQSSFGTGPTQNQPFENGLRPTNTNNLIQSEHFNQPNIGFGNKNEYLPPYSQDPGQSAIAPTLNQQYNNNQAPGFQSPFPQSGNNLGIPQSSFHSQSPAQTFSKFQPEIGSQQFDNFQRPQNSIQNVNGQYPSQPNVALFGQSPASSTGFTPQPVNGPTSSLDSGDDLSQIGQSTSGPFSVGSSQPQFANQFSNGQHSSPASSFPPNPTYESQPTFSSKPESRPFENQYQGPQSVSQTQNLQSQSQNGDSQFSPSTQRPSYAQPMGSDDSYFYNQPSQPFPNQEQFFPNQAGNFPAQPGNFQSQPGRFPIQVPNFPDQTPEFPSTPSNQFQRVTQSPSYPINRYSNAPESYPSTPSVQYSPQGPINYPNPPTLTSSAPTKSTQYQGNTVSGITQASISPFPSVPSTQAPFNLQNQFQSRPGFQQSLNQYNPTQLPQSFEFVSTTAAPQSIPQRIGSQNQQSFGQESTQSTEDSSEQPLSTQQYQGELYEYSKPAQTPPAPENEGQPGAGQFGTTNQGQETTTPGIDGNQDTAAPQFGFQKPERPQFGGKPSRPFNQNILPPEGTTKYPEEESTYDVTSQIGGEPTRPQYNQNSQTQSRPQYGAQTTHLNSQTTDSTESLSPEEPSTQAPFGLRPCCQGSSRFGQSPRPESQDKFPFLQGAFGFNSQFNPSQSSPPKSSSNSFAGKGETFGGPRKPPSFDENGYHY